MVSILYKWFLLLGIFFLFNGSTVHPIYVSITEIEHNNKNKTLEVSCKLYTDDFEKTLKKTYNTYIDLINPKDRAAVDRLINDYVQKHLKLQIDGKAVQLKYLGYENIEEGIYSYYEAVNIEKLKSISIFNNLLYEYHSEQMGLIHVTENGQRKSTKLNNPADKAMIEF